MGWLRDLFLPWHPEPEERALQVTPWGDWGTQVSSYAGMNVSADNADQLLVVYGCVQLISDTIATLPRDIYRNRADDVTEQVTNVPPWFEQPNPNTDIIEFLTQSLWSLLLEGNCYWAYGVDRSFVTNDIRVLDPTKVTITDNGSGPRYSVGGKPFNGRLLHIKGLTRPGKLKGLSPIESARQSIGIGLAVQEFAGNFYKNGTTVSGVIQTPGPLTKDGAKWETYFVWPQTQAVKGPIK